MKQKKTIFCSTKRTRTNQLGLTFFYMHTNAFAHHSYTLSSFSNIEINSGEPTIANSSLPSQTRDSSPFKNQNTQKPFVSSRSLVFAFETRQTYEKKTRVRNRKSLDEKTFWRIFGQLKIKNEMSGNKETKNFSSSNISTKLENDYLRHLLQWLKSFVSLFRRQTIKKGGKISCWDSYGGSCSSWQRFMPRWDPFFSLFFFSRDRCRQGWGGCLKVKKHI